MQAENFRRYLRKTRKDKKLTLRQIEVYSGVSNSYLSQVESGKRGIPSPDILEKLAPILKVSYEELMREAGYLHKESTLPDISKINQAWTIDTNTMKPVYVLGSIGAGKPMYAEENIEGAEWVPSSELNGGEYFYLRVKGNSMKGRIQDGDLVLVRCQEHVENGEIAVVMVNKDDATLKRFYQKENGLIVLRPDNPEYEPIITSGEGVRIIGKVIHVKFDPHKK